MAAGREKHSARASRVDCVLHACTLHVADQ